jgi:hypothetical protein
MAKHSQEIYKHYVQQSAGIFLIPLTNRIAHTAFPNLKADHATSTPNNSNSTVQNMRA